MADSEEPFFEHDIRAGGADNMDMAQTSEPMTPTNRELTRAAVANIEQAFDLIYGTVTSLKPTISGS